MSPVMVAHCGELELRKPVVKKARSPSVEGSEPGIRRKSKARSRSVSEDRRPRREKRKMEKKVREETEEELDLR